MAFEPPAVLRDAELVEFPQPFVHHVQRRCSVCGDSWRVDLLGGASEPREATYRCPDCRRSEPATSAVIEQSRPQLALAREVDGG